MPKKSIEEHRQLIHNRLTGASWYISTNVEEGRIVVYVRSVKHARQYGTVAYNNVPITFVEVPEAPSR